MALQILVGDDLNPGPLVDAGISSDGNKLISTIGWEGTTGSFNSTLDVTGITTIDGLTNLNGGIAVDTNKFTVDSATGNTLVAGDLDVTGAVGITGTITGSVATDITINTDAFTLDAGTKAASFGGALDVTGITTVTGLSNLNGGITVDTDKFTVDATGTTVIAGDLNAGGDLNLAGEIRVGANMFLVSPVTGDMTAGGIVAGSIEVGGDLSLLGDFITFGSTNININSGDFTLNAATKSIVMAGDLRVDGTTFASVNLEMSGSINVTGSIYAMGPAMLNGGININFNKFIVDQVGNVLIDGTTLHHGAVGLGATINAATSGAFEIPLAKAYQSFVTNATDDINATLADGEPGQFITIKLETKDISNLVVTPANFTATYIAFQNSGDLIQLVFDGAKWVPVCTQGNPSIVTV